VVRGEASDLARGLAEVIAEQRVSHVVLLHEPRRGLGLGRASLADRLLDEVPGLEIHLIGEAAHAGSTRGDLPPRSLGMALTVYGALAVAAMLVFYALEARSAWFVVRSRSLRGLIGLWLSARRVAVRRR